MIAFTAGHTRSRIAAKPICSLAAKPKIAPIESKPVVAGMVRIFMDSQFRTKVVYVVVRAGVPTLYIPALAVRKILKGVAKRGQAILPA